MVDPSDMSAQKARKPGGWIARLGIESLLRWSGPRKVAFVLSIGEAAVLTILVSLTLTRFLRANSTVLIEPVILQAIYTTLVFIAVNGVLLAITWSLRDREAAAGGLIAAAVALGMAEIFYYVYLSGLFSIAAFTLAGSILIARVAFGRKMGHLTLAMGFSMMLAMTVLYDLGALAYAPLFGEKLGAYYTDRVVLWQYAALTVTVLGVVYATVDFATDRMEKAISELEQANQELVLAQADLAGSKPLASLGALVAGAAKELNNPLSISLSVSESVVRDLGERYSSGIDREGVSGLFNEISASLEAQQRAARIVTQLADLSKYSQQTSYEPMDVNLSIRQSLQSLANPVAQAGELVSLNLAPELPLARGQMALFTHVFAHVHTNALWALAEGEGQGPLERLPAVEVRTRLEGQRIIYRCQDTGPGMSAEQIGRCREPFYTTRRARGGVGLGLYLADQVVRWAGGNLRLESQEGKGTLVEIDLPVWEG